jgi:cytochrome c biogenesis protein
VGSGWALGGALAAIGGLAASLFIQRRRVWVRAVAGADGRTVVEMAGLGRSESARLPEELGDLAYAVQAQAPPAVDGAETDDLETHDEETHDEETHDEETDTDVTDHDKDEERA